MVAKSYERLALAGEPYEKNGRAYVKVITNKGVEKEVRWYSEKEYNKMYPNKNVIVATLSDTDYRKTFSCGNDGYILLVKDAGDHEDEHMLDLNRKYKCFQYACHLGWFVKNRDNLPTEVEVIKLPWDIISIEDVLLPAEQVKQRVAEFTGVASTSEYQYSIGERHTLMLELTKVKESKDYYGTKYEYTFVHDATGNEFLWRTSAVKLHVNSDYEVTGTVKDYELIEGVKTTILTRCKIK